MHLPIRPDAGGARCRAGGHERTAVRARRDCAYLRWLERSRASEVWERGRARPRRLLVLSSGALASGVAGGHEGECASRRALPLHWRELWAHGLVQVARRMPRQRRVHLLRPLRSRPRLDDRSTHARDHSHRADPQGPRKMGGRSQWARRVHLGRVLRGAPATQDLAHDAGR